MAKKSTAAAVLEANRLQSVDFVRHAGQAKLRSLLKAAQADLDARLKATKLGEETFTVQQMRTTLAQIREVLRQLGPEIEGVIQANAKAASTSVTKRTLNYLDAVNEEFEGLSDAPLALSNAKAFQRVAGKVESSVLARLASNPADPRGRRILDRYGDAVIQQFERRLAVAQASKKPWADVRRELVQESPFLQSAPAHWAERIVRTETAYAENRAAYETMVETDAATGGEMVKILCATFDSRTSSDSYDVHGQIRRIDEPFNAWTGAYMHPPNRPNDRESVVPHFLGTPIPKELKPKSDAEVFARWVYEGRKGSPPPRSLHSTVPMSAFGPESSDRSDAKKSSPTVTTPTPTPKPPAAPPTRPVGTLSPAPTTSAPTPPENAPTGSYELASVAAPPPPVITAGGISPNWTPFHPPRQARPTPIDSAKVAAHRAELPDQSVVDALLDRAKMLSGKVAQYRVAHASMNAKVDGASRDAIYDFTGSGYHGIREAGAIPFDELEKKYGAVAARLYAVQARNIDRAFYVSEDAPQKTTYRGLNNLSDGSLNAFLSSDEFDFGGKITSTSISAAVSWEGFVVAPAPRGTNKVLFELHRKSKGVPIANLSQIPSEFEVLLSGQCAWRITRRTRLKDHNGGQAWLIVAEEI